MTLSEETLLLPGQEARLTEITSKHELVYERFSPHKKRTLLAIVSLCAVLPREYLGQQGLTPMGSVNSNC